MEPIVINLVLEEAPFIICFHKIEVGSSTKFFILATDEKGGRYSYSAEQKDGIWVLTYATKPNAVIKKNEERLLQIMATL